MRALFGARASIWGRGAEMGERVFRGVGFGQFGIWFVLMITMKYEKICDLKPDVRESFQGRLSQRNNHL